MKLSSVGVKNSSGGTEIACSSVLKAVSTSQPSGKKITSVTTQAATVRPTNAAVMGGLGAMISSPGVLVQVLADHPNQEYRHDVGEDHCHQRPRRRHSGIKVEQRLLEDEEREIGAGVTRATAGRGVDLREHAQQEDRLDHDHYSDRAPEVGNIEIAQLLEVARAIHACGFQLLAVHGLQ